MPDISHDPVARTAEFKSAVMAEIESSADQPGIYGASPIDFSRIANAARVLDDLTQKLAPMIAAWTPAEYAKYVSLTAMILHSVVSTLPEGV